jgi:hypothetical protein
MTGGASRLLDRRLAVRLAAVAGVPLEVAGTLLERAHRRIGRIGYAVRAAAFLVCTRAFAARLLPGGVRRHGVGALLTVVLPSPGELLLYLGMTETADTTACAGLLPR